MPKFWEKLQKHVNNALQKQKQEKVSFSLCGEILPCKPGGNTGDVAISSPCMLGFFFFLIFLASVMSPNSVRNLEAGGVE